jgi:hypothetical protein
LQYDGGVICRDRNELYYGQSSFDHRNGTTVRKLLPREMRELANLCLTSNSLAPAILSTRDWLLHLASFPVHTISGPIPTYIVSCSVYQPRKAPKPRMISFSGGIISGTGLAEPVDFLSAWPAGKVCFSRVEEDNVPAGPGHRCIAESGPIVAHSPSPPLGRAGNLFFTFGGVGVPTSNSSVLFFYRLFHIGLVRP